MKIKTQITKAAFDALAEPMRTLYVPDGDTGNFLLDGVDDKEYKSKLDEFRTTNTNLLKNAEKYKDIDPVAYAELKKLQDEIDANEELKLVKEGKWETVLKKRTEAMRLDFEKQIAALSTKYAKHDETVKSLHGENHALKLEKHVLAALDEVGVLAPGARDDILSRARGTWQLNEARELVALDGKGEPVLGKKGEPLTMVEWGQAQLDTAPHLFERAAGAGARGSQKQGNPGNAPKTMAYDPVALAKNAASIASGETRMSMPK